MGVEDMAGHRYGETAMKDVERRKVNRLEKGVGCGAEEGGR